jgi:hypothetical protein
MVLDKGKTRLRTMVRFVVQKNMIFLRLHTQTNGGAPYMPAHTQTIGGAPYMPTQISSFGGAPAIVEVVEGNAPMFFNLPENRSGQLWAARQFKLEIR